MDTGFISLRDVRHAVLDVQEAGPALRHYVANDAAQQLSVGTDVELVRCDLCAFIRMHDAFFMHRDLAMHQCRGLTSHPPSQGDWQHMVFPRRNAALCGHRALQPCIIDTTPDSCKCLLQPCVSASCQNET